MLTVAPRGNTKRLMRLSTPLYCSIHLMVVGKVAALEVIGTIHSLLRSPPTNTVGA